MSKTLTVAQLCQLNDISIEKAEAALAHLQQKGFVSGFVPGQLSSPVTLTASGEQFFSKTAVGSDGAAHEAKSIKSVQAFTGLGLRDCRSALEYCDGDPLWACGYLRYAGSLVNLNCKDPKIWALEAGKRLANDLKIDQDGTISWAQPAPRPSGPKMG